MAKNERREVILEIGVEGGSIALLGFRDTQGAWRFTLRKNESGAFALLPEEEQVGSPVSESTPYLSWTEAPGSKSQSALASSPSRRLASRLRRSCPR